MNQKTVAIQRLRCKVKNRIVLRSIHVSFYICTVRRLCFILNSFTAIQQRRPIANVRPFLLRRGTQAAGPGGGSFKRRSLKLRRGTKEGKDLESDCK